MERFSTMLKTSTAAPAASGEVETEPCDPNHPNLLGENLDDRLRIHKLLVSGGLAGAVSRTLTAPIDRLKMLLQIHDNARGISLQEGWMKMRAEGTYTAYFKGNGANVLKIAPETAMKLTLNDLFKDMVAKDPDQIQPFERMVAGGLAGAVAQFLLYPLDTIRTRLAVCPHGTYKGISHAAYTMWIHEGPRSLYSGLLPSMMGIMPYAGVDITIFEMVREMLMEEFDDNPPSIAILSAGMVSSSVAQGYPLSDSKVAYEAVASAPWG
eukprot:gene6220-2837_t